MDTVQRLDEIKLFDALSSDDLVRWADRFQREHYHRGAEVLRQGAAPTAFYVVDQGELRARERVGDQDFPRAYYFAGDYFGELGLLTGQPGRVTIDVLTDAELLVLDRADFDQLMEEFPGVREKLGPIGRQRARAGRIRFDWQEPDEVTIFFSTKHWIALLQDQWYVVLLAILALVTSIVFLRADAAFLAIILMLIAGTLWAFVVLVAVYTYLDWRNDHYIVTNLRALHVERVLALREDRDEAPIDRIQDVQLRQAGVLANLLDYGDVLIQTAAATQRIVFSRVPHPIALQDLLLAARRRAPSREKAELRESIRGELGHRLNIPVTSDRTIGESGGPVPPAEETREETGEIGFDLLDWLRPVWQWLRDLISFETWLISDGGNTITWRKNGWLLVRESLAPFFLGLFVSLLFLYVLSQGIGFPLVPLILMVVLAFILGWWFYRYWDWQNDIYQISGNRLIDLKKQPLWLEEIRRETTLDRIENIGLSLPGILAQLFNFGTVVIETAGETGAFEFEYVHDPRGVQQEIFRRRERFQQQQRHAEMMRRRSELGEWFEVYDELRQGAVTTEPSEGAIEDGVEADPTAW